MRSIRLVPIALAVLAVMLTAPAAHAVTFTFGDPGALGPTSATSACFTATDRCAATMTFTVGSISVIASSTGSPTSTQTAAVIQDLNPDNAGLGVVYRTSAGGFVDNNLGDEINTGETLILTFNQPVVLGAATFRDEDHESVSSYETFRFRVDGGVFGDHTFGAAFGNTGTTFYFRYGGGHAEDFYLASVSATAAPVPEPGTMFLVGSGVLALASRLRRRG